MFHWAKQIIASLLSKLIISIALNLTFRKAESALESLSPEVYKNVIFASDRSDMLQLLPFFFLPGKSAELSLPALSLQ